MTSAKKSVKFRIPPLSKSMILGSVSINLLGLGLPLTILQVFDRILPNQAVETLSVLVAALFVVVILDVLLKTLRGLSLNFEAMMIGIRASDEAVKCLLSAPSTSIKKLPATVHLERVNAIDSWRDFLSGQARHAIIDIPFALIFGAMIYAIGGPVVLVPITLIGAFMVTSYFIAKRSRRLAKSKKMHEQRRQDFITESLLGLTTMKAMAMEPQMMQRFEALQETGSLISFRTLVTSQLSQTLSATIGSVMMIGVVSTSAFFVVNGYMNMGSMAACSLLSGRMIQPFMVVMNLWNQWQNIDLVKQQAEEVIELGVNGSVESNERRQIDGSLSLRNLSLREEGSDQTVLHNLTLDVVPGAFLGITGYDSDTMSAVTRVIAGHKSVDRGEVLIDGVLVGSKEWNNIRQNVAYVPQDVKLFRGTLLENIVMFRTGSAIDSADEMCQLIGLDQRIHSLPHGYDTMVGMSTAAELPPGMLAMVAVARALVRKPKMLILDNVTCFMDQQAIKMFCRAIELVRGEMTVLITTQQQELLDLTDHLIEFNHGRLGNMPADGRVYPGMAHDSQRVKRVFESDITNIYPLAKTG